MLPTASQVQLLHHRFIYKIVPQGTGGRKPPLPATAAKRSPANPVPLYPASKSAFLIIPARYSKRATMGRPPNRASSSSPWRMVRTNLAPSRVYTPILVDVEPGLMVRTRSFSRVKDCPSTNWPAGTHRWVNIEFNRLGATVGARGCQGLVFYSTRSAVTGLMEAARCAGTMLATRAQTPSARIDPNRTKGSHPFT